MLKNNKVFIVLLAVLIIISAAGITYIFAFQKKELTGREKRLTKLKENYSSYENLKERIAEAEKKVILVDSILFAEGFSIPKNLPQTNFYSFINTYSRDHALYTYTNTEFMGKAIENGFDIYKYRVSGNGTFNNVYKLIYAIENSKDLKKIETAEILDNTTVDTSGTPHFLVKFDLLVKVYHTQADEYTAAASTENDLSQRYTYDAFFPLIRDEIKPNTNNLPDIQNGALLSITPQGAYVTASDQNTYLFVPGDRVYLGYMSDINEENQTVTFVLNKGGIIENKVLSMNRKLK